MTFDDSAPWHTENRGIITKAAKTIENMIRELENPGKAHLEMLETYLRLFLIEMLRKQDEQASVGIL